MSFKNKYFFYFSLFTFLVFSLQTSGQTFKQIEVQSNLGGLKNNHGVSVADIDGDHDLDIFIVAKNKDSESDDFSHSKLFRNNNDGTYTDITTSAGLDNLHPFEDNHTDDSGYVDNGSYDGYKFGAYWGDYDNDGFPDLLLTNAYRVQLFKNKGDSTFENVTSTSGFQEITNCLNSGALWFDYNNDGHLDVYINNYGGSCGGNLLYKNKGDGTFEDVSLSTQITTQNRFTYMTVPIDVNNDGYLDIYTANDYIEDNDLFINTNGTTFSNQNATYKVDKVTNAMGIAVGDYNNDGNFDIFVTNIDANRLFKNNGTDFTDVATDVGVKNADWAWDTRFADFDLDGDEDLFVANGFSYRRKSNMLFKNLLIEGEDKFEDISEESNLDHHGYSFSSAIFDFDNDGDLDVFVGNADAHSIFYENKTIVQNQTSDLKWFKIKLKGTTSNRNGIGAKISLATNKGTYHRFYHGAGLYAQSIQPVHFGLSDANTITEVKITWPSGTVETYSSSLNLNKTVLFTEGSGFTELNINPSTKISGCTDPTSCNYNPLATIDDGSCTYLSSGAIIGNLFSSYLSEEEYTYSTKVDHTYQWKVDGGELISGQGTGTIKVKWDLGLSGKITLIESKDCSTAPIIANVGLNITQTLQDFSVARIWNEALLEAIRNDYARPTVHARNLFHTSIAMYDAWAVFDATADTYLLGNTIHGFENVFNGFTPVESVEESRKKAITYACYRLLTHRFAKSPGFSDSSYIFDLIMAELGYDKNFADADYSSGNAAALGNYIAQSIINYGNTDGSNEANEYVNTFYTPVNTALTVNLPGIDDSIDPNRWQPLSFDSFIDQSGNVLGGITPDFLSPEWGSVHPFSLQDSDKKTYSRDGNNYEIYLDPNAPPYLEDSDLTSVDSEAYKWGFSMVSIWSAHLDPDDGVLWDISPKSIGNFDLNSLPKNFTELPNFYKYLSGGDISTGRATNPVTNQPYQEQLVPRGDYGRVLAEFWADGPDSETPPGHWFTILNYVNDHPQLEKKFTGTGAVLDDLEWDVKSYFSLAGAMHDAAITAWGIKGWYDYIRPVSAIRYLAAKGQSSDNSLPNYNEAGIPLVDGYIELIKTGDVLQGNNGENIDKIKLKAWRGHDFISDVATDYAKVGWILAEEWMPYQRSSFVTPPFAGYVSGHSTYSRAAAELLTRLTGTEYFPGGMGEFIARKNEFLVFEEGPSVDVTLQWATYQDASDQCSLSRIWGGIHPPADDIPGRIIGSKIGKDAFDYAKHYFEGNKTLTTKDLSLQKFMVYPNPVITNEIQIQYKGSIESLVLYDVRGTQIPIEFDGNTAKKGNVKVKLPSSISSGVYILKVNQTSLKIIISQ